MKKDTEKANI